MSKIKKAILIFTATIVFVCVGLIAYKVINPVYLFPEPLLGKGIYRLNGIDSGEGLIWSPDGKYLAGLIREMPVPGFCFFCSESHSEIYIVNTETWQKNTISRTNFFEKDIQKITWLPDSRYIAYVPSVNSLNEESKIWAIDIYGQNDGIIIQEDDSFPVWSPDGTKIALLETQKISGNWQSFIFILDSSTKEKHQVFKSKFVGYTIKDVSWDSVGKSIIFSYGKDLDIFILNLESEELTQITNDEFEYWAARYSPTNNLIALQRIDNNAPDFDHRYMTVIKDFLNGCEVVLPILDTTSVSWSPDGQKLVITSNGDAYIVNLAEYFGSKFTETGSICP